MKRVSRAISSWGAIFVLPVKGPEQVRLTPEPSDTLNVSLEYGVVKLFVQTELHEGYYVPLQIWSGREMGYNISTLDREDHHGDT